MSRGGTRLVAIPLLACALVAAGCADAGRDELQIVENPVAATPATSPEPASAPAGTVLPVTGTVAALAVEPASRTLAVAVTEPPAVLLFALGDPEAVPRSVDLPAPAERLSVVGGQVVASVPEAGVVARVSVPDGQVERVPVTGQPVDVAGQGDHLLVAVRDRKAIEVLDGAAVTRTITGQLDSVDEIITEGAHPVVLDRVRTALFRLDVERGDVGEGLRAGQGATNAVPDGFGRVLVTDTRAGALLAFSTEPLLLRQRYPVPGGVYGIAYDDERHLAWVTLTERNEVVGFDVRGGEPTERFRLPTVRQPNSVAVDDRTGRVVVGSATGEGIQVITP
ncbi:hypothetical protein SAMN05421810_10982 [Amycolatopsis arida]|uniref:Lipoprotein n=1 Tax=Amycolatopsis arida TaxID=587909 RepID=A0A1I5ZDT6_9PSEU|nr:hypothetical protein [Amycolatopsis arida]TDX89560.1 hypothetical protein CLV69_10981 [Amycolatopsis arida]SFQ54592.1 hypothetical protein SAMN05421810_10982 [Amycolatopsis arida]